MDQTKHLKSLVTQKRNRINYLATVIITGTKRRRGLGLMDKDERIEMVNGSSISFQEGATDKFRGIFGQAADDSPTGILKQFRTQWRLQDLHPYNHRHETCN